MNALVTVVVPAYNRAPVIARALDSILKQTHANWEANVVDDGSEDDTARIVRRYAESDSRIRLLANKRNKGAQGARNTGINAGGGEWVAFLDSDDYWLPESLALRLRAAAESGASVVHAAGLVIRDGMGEPIFYPRPPLRGRVFKALLQRGGPMFQTILVKREALARIDGLDEAIVAQQEWDTSVRLAEHYEFAYVEEPTFIYDCRGEGSISSNPLRTTKGYEQVFTKQWQSILRQLGPRAMARHYRTAAQRYRERNALDEARRCMRKSLLWWPFQVRTIMAMIHGRFRRGVSDTG